MEVTTESGIMSGREPFSGGMQTNPIPPPPPMLNMRLAYAPDGTAFYQPIMSGPPPPYRGGGSTGGGVGPIPAVGSHSPNINMGIPGKKKRGRPRKYGPEGTMALALIPVSNGGAGDFSPSPGALHHRPASSEAAKKARPRPSGLGKKQQMSALGSAGVGFTPHIITVQAGEDVSSKIMSFSQHGPRAICILSANGGICNVTIRQAATSGGTVTYEGRFEILTLSGSFMLSESDGQRSRTGGLSVSLAAPDGRIFGGGVAGPLTAATPVQVIVGSFIVDGKKEPKPMIPSNPTPPPPPPPEKLTPVGPTAPQSPPSRITQTDDSSDSPGSPVNQSTGTSNNSNQQLIWN